MTGRRGVRKQATSTGGPQTLGAGLGQVTLVTHDQYVDRDEEKEILKIAISMNVDLDTARMALIQACMIQNWF